MHERARVSSSSRNQLSLYAAEAGVSTRAAARSSQNAENNDKIPKQSMSPHVAETVLDQHEFGRPNRAHKALSRKGGISWKKERKSAELKCRRRRHLVVTPPASINVTKHRALARSNASSLHNNRQLLSHRVRSTIFVVLTGRSHGPGPAGGHEAPAHARHFEYGGALFEVSALYDEAALFVPLALFFGELVLPADLALALLAEDVTRVMEAGHHLPLLHGALEVVHGLCAGAGGEGRLVGL